ncbi:hypothetical protein OIU84_011450 [Salix udensis]|uniref:Uncharacterized protein n=1 Tax=Salix udensis TaxID=889485 RepID=A0AAD6NX77_9ROSI|nr:hypothetical protein OIU84_011450 [Salix udensis]
MVVSCTPCALPIWARLLSTVTPDPTPTKYTKKSSQKSAFTRASVNLKSSPLLGLLLFFTAPSPSARSIATSDASTFSRKLPRAAADEDDFSSGSVLSALSSCITLSEDSTGW